jgi:hypothetical protein
MEAWDICIRRIVNEKERDTGNCIRILLLE